MKIQTSHKESGNQLHPLRSHRIAIGIMVAVLVIALTGNVAPTPTLANSHIWDDAIVRCDPNPISGDTFDTLTIDMYIENVVDLYGVDLELSFDPAIAYVLDEDGFAGNGVQIRPLYTFLIPGFTLFQSADNVNGNIHYVTAQLNPTPPATGSGPVARFRLQAHQPGTFTMQFTRHDLSDRNGTIIPNVAESCTVTFAVPTAVAIAHFSAAWQGEAILVSWETASELDVLGFNLYRGDASEGEFVQLNTSLIPAQSPGALFGEDYTYMDEAAPGNGPVYYKLAAIDTDEGSTWVGPALADPGEPTPVTITHFNANPAFAAPWLATLLVLAEMEYIVTRQRRITRYR
ncbi:MAG: hypothetical protein JXB35_13115 [Anaerolineae bacterium]|nr:hypothetical protein [Anaerolineae bacterium]